MKIALIDPKGDVSGFNAGLGIIAAVLSGAGHEIKVYDCNNGLAGAETVLSRIMAWRPDMAGFSVKTNTLTAAVEMAAALAKEGIRVFAGGAGITCQGNQFITEHQFFHAAFLGEVDDTIAAYVEHASDGEFLKTLPGICFLDSKDVFCAGIHLPGDINTIPDFSAFDTAAQITGDYPLVTSRGCPFDCIYCSVNKISGRLWRKRSAESVVAEIKKAYETHGITGFVIADDNFTMDIARAKEICNLLIREHLPIRWRCINGIRADRVDEDLLALMKAAGCDTVWFGIESMNENIFNAIKKGEELAAVTRAVRWAKKAGMSVGGFFIAGLPGSTYAQDRSTLAQARKLELDEMLWSIATPFPDTEFWDWAQKNGRRLGDYRTTSFFKLPRPVFETDDYPAGERLKMFYEGNLAGYSYSCFFSRRITVADVIMFVVFILRYDMRNILTHIGKIFFGKYHRKYLREALKRLFRN
ncbi:MAG: hypothetical protein A2219_08515 [Elusimicrobia bacterium RIFOXYA2_FULL_50_26]|nr:MAG: hypothetical protein A2219_08515 [Elusimicrobia bacterium RIFOXYA2_FULL_50_26]